MSVVNGQLAVDWRWSRPLTSSAWACVLLAATVGCSRSGSARLVPVGGSVTANGTPLTTGSVTFHPDASKGNLTSHIPVAAIDAQGNYKLMTATQAGAPPGWYRVTVSAQEPIDPKNPYAAPKHLIDQRYADANTSGIAVEVVGSPAPGAYDIKLAK